MKIVRVREFRTSQGKYLKMAREGQDIMLTSRLGMFKIVPLPDEENEQDNINEMQ